MSIFNSCVTNIRAAGGVQTIIIGMSVVFLGLALLFLSIRIFQKIVRSFAVTQVRKRRKAGTVHRANINMEHVAASIALTLHLRKLRHPPLDLKIELPAFSPWKQIKRLYGIDR